ncbi:HAMP domain-containing sensor histidine kinase [Marivirga salinae]|uniref:histidine kinase n=1 Tax=Marivirga salinarum TaxID=3059078 RepID=A0AA51NB10_9BACT|nr:HAMP domain-containing sensor histidine kinase [Marivirga sp. BDSF4-3]WMN12052.1 HAMP domain-containing sensor histidine kinase [Marivirga sp. BDSF4-3]
MKKHNFLQRIKKWLFDAKSNGYMLLIVFFVSGSLLIMNYYTIRVLSGVRAYIQGESYYSKGQKDASRYLLMYIDTQNEEYWEFFKENLNIPLCDREARIALLNGNKEKAEKKLIDGKNHPDDVEDMVWLFTSFQSMQFVQDPLKSWTKADSILVQHLNLGNEAKSIILNDTLNDSNRDDFKQRIFEQGIQITIQETDFLKSLGKTSRQLRDLIFLVNTFLIIVIVGGASVFSMRIISKLINSEERLTEKNKELKNTNAELDKFVYSASHDLRAPITSLKGLIKVTKLAKDPDKVNQYFSLLEKSLEKQDDFIKQIISFSKNKRADLIIERVDIKDLIGKIVDQLKYMYDFSSSSIVKTDISINHFYSDPNRLDIIMSNLISNAIKYKDPNKEKNIVEISVIKKGDRIQLSVKDNGIGISETNKDKIFDMFYMTKHSTEGTGVGLYIVIETLEKLNGNITVYSELGKGTVFTVNLPVYV